ncbi:hypothetical protein GCM10017674_66910 [Streptomyces gardneri]|uniref:Uncharacterized protein n=1 Tax=Streptomyces gardneri TaxID=66892 RepID=A0A4Y3RHE1_9ACTN|nr:hypothetical protein SGA01_26700 [Streptomyces gardneri]GHH16707.1 hypothetical protein GCM10017674_66910 [Streptomyces gardneri]
MTARDGAPAKREEPCARRLLSRAPGRAQSPPPLRPGSTGIPGPGDTETIVIGLGTGCILDGLEVTIAGNVAGLRAASAWGGARGRPRYLCLARRRADFLFAMLRDGTYYEPQPPAEVN